MARPGPVELDVVIFGGGAAGLWLLDHLHRAGYGCLLLETTALGTGQTVASQGIIHGGLKYSLGGLLSPSARAIRAMPGIWRECLQDRRHPHLGRTLVRAEHCHIWQTESLRSRFAMLGARAGLQVRPVTLEPDERPDVLSACPGAVARLDEQVIDPASFLRNLAGQHVDRLVRIEPGEGTRLEHDGHGGVEQIIVRRADDEQLRLRPRTTILTAGAGNAELCRQLGLPAGMQRRPLHMVLARGDLPVINGHCVDGASTRLTITTAEDADGRRVWQVGGQVAEQGVSLEPRALVAHARRELAAVLPDLDLAGSEWSTYRVDRAEGRTSVGRRPQAAFVRATGRTIVAWPTKLALAPQLADQVAGLLPTPAAASIPNDAVAGWPRPEVAAPPWETMSTWHLDP